MEFYEFFSQLILQENEKKESSDLCLQGIIGGFQNSLCFDF